MMKIKNNMYIIKIIHSTKPFDLCTRCYAHFGNAMYTCYNYRYLHFCQRDRKLVDFCIS